MNLFDGVCEETVRNMLFESNHCAIRDLILNSSSRVKNSVMLSTILHKEHNFKLRHLIRDAIKTPNDISSMIKRALDVYHVKNCVPMAIKRGVADSFNIVSAAKLLERYSYQPSIRDIMRIVHPKPIPERVALFQQLYNR